MSREHKGRPLSMPSSAITFLFLGILLIGSFLLWTNVSTGSVNLGVLRYFRPEKLTNRPFNWYLQGRNRTCSTNYPVTFEAGGLPAAGACPEYFQWIHEDLRPWKESGISREMVERARDYAQFRLVIVKGKVYMEKLKESYQTRDAFTIWGILQLLRLYPGKLPDLELTFCCGDKTVIKKTNHGGPNTRSPPALFQYCGQEKTLSIVFPDWTFWGWAETNIKPWRNMLESIVEGNKKTKWKDRAPYAHWKGNPDVAQQRVELMRCNVSSEYDWKARLYKQDWERESREGFRSSKLEDQCTYRYKIYIEGSAWSVSDKYILACDSMTLLFKPDYYDFFLRSMVPMKHYWPIETRNKCSGIKFAVEWGNNHTDKAEAIGKEGSRFIQENLKMEYVYDYMFHLLSEYAELLKFKPKVPKGAVQVCPESMVSSAAGLWKQFMLQSMVHSPSDTSPCTMPSPRDIGFKH